jgi:NADH:ubiquinone oxidoreductase subunit 4 (subunit M)
MILAAILLKMGGYGIFRIAYRSIPNAGKELWMVFAIIGVVSIIYGALCAMSQTDFKKLVAYSSVSHMGFVTLGAAMMTDAAVNGALFMMIAHGITSAMMFFIVGVIYDRAHHRELARFGGIAPRCRFTPASAPSPASQTSACRRPAASSASSWSSPARSRRPSPTRSSCRRRTGRRIRAS